ncbi:MAG: hypothetical protein JWQ22_1911 [Devosia sp.]|nr:hypothetical protein [Devosia sp.]
MIFLFDAQMLELICEKKKGAKPKFRAPTGDTTEERQPLQQSTDRLAL